MQTDSVRWKQDNERVFTENLMAVTSCGIIQILLLCRFISEIVSHENIHVKHKYTPLPAKFWIRKPGSPSMFQSEDIDILPNLSFIWELNHSEAWLADS